MTMSRRGFLRSLGIGAATAVVAPSLIADAVASTPPTGIAKAVGEGRVALNPPLASPAPATVIVDPFTKTLTPTGPMTMLEMYRSVKQQWLDDPMDQNLVAYQFPMVPVTQEYMEFDGGWNIDAPETVNAGSWAVRGDDGKVVERWAVFHQIDDLDTPLLDGPHTDYFAGQIVL